MTRTPTRIALVSAFPPGRQTLNEYGYHLAKGLAAHPDVSEVIVIADKLDGPAAELDLGPKVRVERVWSYNSLSSGWKILKHLRNAAPDGVLWNLQVASFGDREVPAALGLFAPAVARMAGLRSGVIAHNILSGIDLDNTQLKGQRLRQAIIRAAGSVVMRGLLGASYLTVTLRGYFDELQAKYPKAPTFLVPHGTFETGDFASTPLAARPGRIVTMGKFGTYKRLDTLLQAFDILRQRPEFADYELVIGGSDHPSTPGYVQNLAEQRRADTGVVFHGYVAEDDIPAFFGEARLSVFDYSATTGSSGVLHQTASYGAVPVFPNIGDFVDVSRDEGITGANYQPGDAQGMAQAMARMLTETETAQRVSDQNLEASVGIPFSDIIEFHVDRLAPVAASVGRARANQHLEQAAFAA